MYPAKVITASICCKLSRIGMLAGHPKFASLCILPVVLGWPPRHCGCVGGSGVGGGRGRWGAGCSGEAAGGRWRWWRGSYGPRRKAAFVHTEKQGSVNNSLLNYIMKFYFNPLKLIENLMDTEVRPHLAGVVVLHLPASGQLQLFVWEHVEEGHQVPVVLVALVVVSIPTNLTDHMLQTRVGGEHTVGTLRERGAREEGGGKDRKKRGNTSTREKRERFC